MGHILKAADLFLHLQRFENHHDQDSNFNGSSKTDVFSFRAKTEVSWFFFFASVCAAAAGRWDKCFPELLFNTASLKRLLIDSKR